MEVKIGVQHAPRELVVETDRHGRGRSRPRWPRRWPTTACSRSPTPRAARSSCPARKIAYVEIGDRRHAGPVGFRG